MNKGFYNSVWNGGDEVITTLCEFDFENNIIQNVGQVSDGAIKNCHELDREYVEDFEGNEYEVCTNCHEHFLKVRMVEDEHNSTILNEEQFCKFCEESEDE